MTATIARGFWRGRRVLAIERYDHYWHEALCDIGRRGPVWIPLCDLTLELAGP